MEDEKLNVQLHEGMDFVTGGGDRMVRFWFITEIDVANGRLWYVEMAAPWTSIMLPIDEMREDIDNGAARPFTYLSGMEPRS